MQGLGDLLGVFLAALLEQHRGDAELRLGRLAVKLGRGPKACQRAAGIAQPGLDLAKPHLYGGRLRIHPHDLLEGLDRLLLVVGAQKERAQRIEQLRILGLLRQCLLNKRNRVFRLADLDLLLRKCQQRLDGGRVGGLCLLE